MAERPTAIDLYCGSGAVTSALRRKGFHVLVGLDNDPVACTTYRLNHPGVHLIERDIRQVEPKSLIEDGLAVGDLDLLVICAPCQPFSSQNRKRAEDDRAELIIEGSRFAEVLKPKCILIENVPGLTTPANAHIVARLAERLNKAGYLLSKPRRIDAAEMGVPQRRVRCVMIAACTARAVHIFEDAQFPRRHRTVRDAIGTLVPLASGECHPKDTLHRARCHQKIALERLKAIPKDGGSRSHLPEHLTLKCHRDPHSFSDVYGRMQWDGVAPTLTTGCDDVTRGRFAHPEQDRAITLREAALLQTFPKCYVFAGNRREIACQIGNAVPVSMIEGFVPTLKRVLKAATGATGGKPH